VTDLQPDVPDVLQEEEDGGITVPVCVVDQKSPIRTQALPRKGGATLTRSATTTPLRVLTADHRRARAQLLATGVDEVFLVAFSRAAAQSEDTMTRWCGRVPFETTATTEVWIRVPTTPGTAVTVGVAVELWAEGE